MTATRLGPWAVALLGPTASGKSDLAIALAETFDCEIVCCDSMQVYQGLDIGTGKPTSTEQARVPHHLLDVVRPDQDFHAGAWARQARPIVQDICDRGKVPLIVGGTGLYFRALTQGLFDAPAADPEIRARHKTQADARGVPALHAQLVAVDPEAAAKISPNDLVRTSRALEVWEQTGQPISALWKQAQPERPVRTFQVVFDRPLDELRQLIDRRVDAMMAGGFLEEVVRLREQGFGAARPLAGLGYKELRQHLDGSCDLPAAVAATKLNTGAYARRQRTWFRKGQPQVRLAGRPELGALIPLVRAWLASL